MLTSHRMRAHFPLYARSLSGLELDAMCSGTSLHDTLQLAMLKMLCSES